MLSVCYIYRVLKKHMCFGNGPVFCAIQGLGFPSRACSFPNLSVKMNQAFNRTWKFIILRGVFLNEGSWKNW